MSCTFDSHFFVKMIQKTVLKVYPTSHADDLVVLIHELRISFECVEYASSPKRGNGRLILDDDGRNLNLENHA